jgi:hypothetical protein
MLRIHYCHLTDRSFWGDVLRVKDPGHRLVPTVTRLGGSWLPSCDDDATSLSGTIRGRRADHGGRAGRSQGTTGQKGSQTSSPLARQLLSPGKIRVGLERIELSTSALSVLRSNRLSYSPSRVRQSTAPGHRPLCAGSREQWPILSRVTRAVCRRRATVVRRTTGWPCRGILPPRSTGRRPPGRSR